MKNKPPVIKEVVQLMLDGEFKKSRKKAIDEKWIITNPYFFEQGKLEDFFSNDHHIVCKLTQPGVSPRKKYYTSYLYEVYKIYYDEWVKPYNRDIKLEQLLGR